MEDSIPYANTVINVSIVSDVLYVDMLIIVIIVKILPFFLFVIIVRSVSDV
jgi:hypothetical protein